jgi:hypothetical protein
MSSLISLPLRIGVRTARASLQATRDLADLGLATLELLGRALGQEPPGADEIDVDIDLEVELSSDHDGEEFAPRAAPKPAPSPPPAPVGSPVAPAPPVAEPEAPFTPPPPPPPPAGPVQPVPPLSAVQDTAVDIGLEPEEHSPDERELVEEFADAGAEDGAGATFRIAAPFDGYDELRAPDVIARLPGVDAAELGETELYERTHRARRTVLDALARELRRRGAA